MPHKFNPEKMDVLLSDDRIELRNRVMDILALDKGESIADIGCGPGWFTLEAAKKVGPRGTAYAVDVSDRMLNRVQKRAKLEGINNIKLLHVEDRKETTYDIPSHSLNAVILINTFHEFENLEGLALEVCRILKPGSPFLVTDWTLEDTGIGPKLHHRISPEIVKDYFKKFNLVVHSTPDVGPHHWCQIFYQLEPRWQINMM